MLLVAVQGCLVTKCAVVVSTNFTARLGHRASDSRGECSGCCGECTTATDTPDMARPALRAEEYARALRASQNVKRAEVWVGERSA
jgi:hypothetical protein